MKSCLPTGFTLLELLTTILLVAILAMLAIPSMSEFIKNERLTTQINGLVASLQRARSEAILRHVPITLCSSDDGATCTGDDWNEGWIVFVDTDGSGSVDAGETLIQVRDTLEGNTTLSSSSGTTLITYDSRGFTPNTAITFSLCDDRGSSYGKAISINNIGRVSLGGAVSC